MINLIGLITKVGFVSSSFLDLEDIPDLSSYSLLTGVDEVEDELRHGIDLASPPRFSDIPSPPISPMGRVIERFSPEQLSHMDDRIKDSMIRQIHTDEELDAYTPNFDLQNIHESVPQFGRIELEALAVISSNALVFTVRNNPAILVKYVHDCDGGFLPTIPHPLLTETWLQATAARQGLAPKVFFVSPPARLPSDFSVSQKVSFQLSSDEYLECVFGQTTVRFAVIERLHGRSLQGLYRDGKIGGFEDGIQIGKALIPRLQALHAQGIVHGDLAIDRISLTRDNEGKIQLRFINFLSASVTDKFGIATTIPKTHSATNDARRHLKSPWELIGGPYHRSTRRDDLFRLIQIVAHIMSPRGTYDEGQRHVLSMGGKFLAEWKQTGPLFKSPLAPGMASNLTITEYGKKLIEIERSVRVSSPFVPAFIYGRLSRIFKEIQQILKRDARVDNNTTIVANITIPTTPGPCSTVFDHEPSFTSRHGRPLKRKRDY